MFAGCAMAAFFVLSPAQAVGEDADPGVPEAPAPAVVEETPGAPNPVERMVEESSDAPPTVPTVDPTVNPPSPAVTNTESNLSGIQFQGGVPGGSFGSTGGNGQSGMAAFGAGGNAHEVVFVVDASGSMMSVFPFVLKELGRVVGGLDEDQQFTLIFFNGRGVFEVPVGGQRTGLRPATPEFKLEVEAWVAPEEGNIVLGGPGSRNAIAAITRGLSYQPGLMFIFSDGLTGSGRYEIYQDDILEAIEEANTREQPTRINTIQLIQHDPLNAMGMPGTLQLIAEETGGVYKFLDDSYLHLR